MMEEFVSLLGLASLREAQRYLVSSDETIFSRLAGQRDSMDINTWLKAFECLVVRMSEGRTISELGVKAVMDFVSRRPSRVELFSCPDDQFGLIMDRKAVSSSKFDSKALWALFTPTQPHHAATTLHAFRWFISYSFGLPFMKHIWNGWLPSFTNVVDPSKLPFTSEFIPLHTELIEFLKDHPTEMREYEKKIPCNPKDELRVELDELYLAFYSHTKDYIIHLSLHPFALDSDDNDTILDFLIPFFQSCFDNTLDKPFREELRKEMDESALSSPSPPFILTSELVFRLSDTEIMNIVDRIVALLDSNSPLDDDTILRICAFHRMQHKWVYLPDLFRKVGRSTEQYLHALESLLSLHLAYLHRAPIKYLLSTQWNKKPTLDEWDDVDLESVGIVMQMINQNNLSFKHASSRLLIYAIQALQQTRHCATRVSLSQLERLIAPSVGIISRFFVQSHDFEMEQRWESETIFSYFCILCDERVIVQCFSRTGFFSHIVTRLFNFDFNTSEYPLDMIIDHHMYDRRPIKDQKTIPRTIPNFLEEGWQDALEFIFVTGKHIDRADIQFKTEKMIQFFGANFRGLQR
ncbi:hypothetical protein BLNAU_21170 [Blattamonas nauphoetae]|uniref:Uncharacterized protein n=1 Tax=Blattamonas nauphoetae TaxID=2049346 RepID=A0ABQ9X0U1_9EUKA|nr:hypothetical protein BLNAU_21170 [Blattamonas nauphoetae]